MLGFFDESGDTGLKIGNGSSRYFVVALVTFDDDQSAGDCNRRIDRVRSELRLANSYEFRFSKNSRNVREAFFRAVNEFDFRYHTFALDKDPGKLRNQVVGNGEVLYQDIVLRLFRNTRSYLSDAIVVLDRHGNHKARGGLAQLIRSGANTVAGERAIKRVRQQDSRKNNLLQLADYVAVVTNRAISGERNAIGLEEMYLRAKRATQEIWPK